MKELKLTPATAAQVRDYLVHLTNVKNSISIPELEMEKVEKEFDKPPILLYHISDNGMRKLTLTEDVYKIYLEL